MGYIQSMGLQRAGHDRVSMHTQQAVTSDRIIISKNGYWLSNRSNYAVSLHT